MKLVIITSVLITACAIAITAFLIFSSDVMEQADKLDNQE